MANWRLFIDETGNFDDTDVHVAVAGWMVRWDDEPCLRWTMRARVLFEAALFESFPLLQYPPHAAVLSWNSAFLASWSLRDTDRDLSGRLALLEPSLALLEAEVRASTDPRCRDFCAAIDDQLRLAEFRRRLPPIEFLGPVDSWLGAQALVRSDFATALGDLRSMRDDWSLLSRFVIDQLPLHANETEVRCFALAAVSRAGSWPEEESGETSGDRYLDLLVVLFERLFHLLRASHSMPPVVEVRVLERDVRGAHAARPLSVADIERAVAVARRTLFKRGSDDVTVRIHGVDRWDADTHVGLVIADQIAWRLRRTLIEPSWYRLKDRWAQLTETPLECVPRSAAGDPTRLPCLAVSGSARNAIESAIGATVPPGMARISPSWAREQASRWIHALPTLTG